MDSPSEWKRVTKDKPCPICGKSDWCTVSIGVAYCMRVESDKPAKGDAGGWIHNLGDDVKSVPSVIRHKKKRLTDEQLHAKWEPQARRMWRNAGGDMKRLAEQLGVSTASLNELRVGYGELACRWCWSFPERNSSGLVVGISRRLVEPVNGTGKLQVPGSRRGLSYAADGNEYGGPVYIVEGGSDTAAGLTLGLSVIGRPSNVGGMNYLVPMLRRIDKQRRIVVLGERDRKKHEDLAEVARKRHKLNCTGCQLCWPGKFGARQTAEKLRARLKRRVEWWMLPGGAKDLRGWLNAQEIDVEDSEAAFELGGATFK